jgi:endonuclease/exonuclease/phosphatase family metal-dependent hydrolase
MAFITNKTEFPNVAGKPVDITPLFSPIQNKLDKEIPKKRDENLLIATWNIKAFGNITRKGKMKKWESDNNDSPKRDVLSIAYITEIISRFDVIAVQEVKTSLSALRYVLKLLGDDWGFILTDSNLGKGGNSERLAYIFNGKRVKISGLAGEITIPPKKDENGDFISQLQFIRTPYAVSFQSIKGKKTFILLTVHIDYTNRKNRTQEIINLADWVNEWSLELAQWNHSLILLGDFNIESTNNEKNYKALTNTVYTSQKN